MKVSFNKEFFYNTMWLLIESKKSAMHILKKTKVSSMNFHARKDQNLCKLAIIIRGKTFHLIGKKMNVFTFDK